MSKRLVQISITEEDRDKFREWYTRHAGLRHDNTGFTALLEQAKGVREKTARERIEEAMRGLGKAEDYADE